VASLSAVARASFSSVVDKHPLPGAMIHVDVKKLGRVLRGCGWRLHGHSEAVKGRGNGLELTEVVDSLGSRFEETGCRSECGVRRT
jgi:hypothetical protein